MGATDGGQPDDRQDDRRILSVTEGSPAERVEGGIGVEAAAGAPSAARRRRWRSLLRLTVAGALVIVVVGAAFVLWPLLWVPDPDDSVQVVNGRLIGETWGYIARVDREGQAVSISRSVFGWHPVLLTVNHETLITVRDREGGLGDILKDMPVRVTYEVVGDRRRARSIEVGASRPEGAPPVASRPVAPAPPAAARAVETAPAPPAPAPAVAPAVAPAPTPVRQTASPGGPVPPAPSTGLARSPASPPPARAETRRPSTVAESVAEPAPRREPADTDPADGSAIIDWLINESRRR